MSSRLEIVKELISSNPSKTRFNCVFCGGINSLSVSQDNGILQYHCFRAGCNAKGIEKQGLDYSYISTLLGRAENRIAPSFQIPLHFVSVLNQPKAYKYLEDNHCLFAYLNDRANIVFDPKLNRVVFLAYNPKNEVVNATGRSLDNTTLPKWLIYSKSSYPFITNKQFPTLVVVEDCASACAVSHIATGMALLGTNFKDEYTHLIRPYKRVIIALDKDAFNKSISLYDNLKWYKDCCIILLEHDLKKLNPVQVNETLKRHLVV